MTWFAALARALCTRAEIPGAHPGHRHHAAWWGSIALASILVTQGCAATTSPPVRPDTRDDVADAEAASYRQGIRDALATLQRTGGGPAVTTPGQAERPSDVGPVMQEVWMPAQVIGGMVIPAHREWVVVRPGTWRVPGASGQRAP